MTEVAPFLGKAGYTVGGLWVGFEGKLPKEVHSASFVGACRKHCRGFLPLHGWMLETLTKRR